METKTKKSQPIITLLVKVTAKAEHIENTRTTLLADVHGAWTEPGNYKMELYQAIGKPESFYLMERWSDQLALDSHFSQPYAKEALNLQDADLEGPIEMTYLSDFWPRVQDKTKNLLHRTLITLIVPFEVRPGQAIEFIRLFEEFVPIAREETGNVDFNFYHVSGQENHFVLYERWEKQSDIDQHNSLSTTVEMVENIKPMLTAPIGEFILFCEDISSSGT